MLASQDSLGLPDGYWNEYYDMAEGFIDTQWLGLIYPMLRNSNFSRVLELASGACRNTEKLALLADRMLVTDIDPAAISRCKQRFEGRVDQMKLEYVVVNSSADLPCPNESVSLVYQFDAGVHFHAELVRQHVQEMSRVLIPGGTGFYHYSNLAASEALPPGRQISEDPFYNPSARAHMKRARFETFAKESGLVMLCNPTVDWEGMRMLDAFARFRKPDGLPYNSGEEICHPRLAWRSYSGGWPRGFPPVNHTVDRLRHCLRHIAETGCEALVDKWLDWQQSVGWPPPRPAVARAALLATQQASAIKLFALVHGTHAR